jgi:hypothetical protein
VAFSQAGGRLERILGDPTPGVHGSIRSVAVSRDQRLIYFSLWVTEAEVWLMSVER